MTKLFLQREQPFKSKLDRTVKLLKWAQSCYVQTQLSHMM